MTKVELKVSGVNTNFGSVWVHITEVDPLTSLPYCAKIGKESIDYVFDAQDKVTEVSWNDYLLSEISELGSSMLSLYFTKMCKLSEDNETDYKWLIATLDNVVEDANGITLEGKAIPFDSNKFLM
jgi:hypothetical protein